ncbi:6-phosphogluconolactonase [Puia dinghuensis]|uniref:6-phosphogluconolactonase n=1 Tax=Puia dinghuensis TaxID=1792502 RepID=A0A8J2UFM8_9BACT|nr:6-phosphogluconolactonase [Puia dinghuensis]GGB10050.1 6-phosphogluconolactonase [Puia dinghuensis]
MELHVFKDGETLSNAAAKFIADSITATLKTKDRYTIALSGGSTPKRLHQILAQPPYKEQIDWTKLHVFWGDERAVPFEDSRNNAKMAYDTLLNFVPVPAGQVHVMRTDIPPEQSAAEYEKILHGYFDNTDTSFDLVLLGMGDDGHTLSLFPGTPVIHEEKLWTTAFWLQAQDMYRITLTKVIVNRSACVAFLTTGSTKAHALQEVLKGAYNPDHYPSQVIKPVGQLHWFVDEAAAAQLK